jgi:hypothetical protein
MSQKLAEMAENWEDTLPALEPLVSV